MTVLAWLAALASIPLLLASAYLFGLTLLSWRLREPSPSRKAVTFDVIVPAHNEEAGIGRTVQSLRALDYPAGAFRVLVVADNCSDATAARAMEAGAHVLERHDTERRGKGYALAHAFERSLEDGFADAVVVIDADTIVSPNLLRAFAARLATGASAIQAEYGVANPDASWRTQLMAVAFALFHRVRSLGRERLGLSCGLRGNGMCFRRELLLTVPHRAFSIVEDVEYGLALGRAGVRVHFAHEAHVLGDMVAKEQGARSQRQRWEGGRMALVREVAPPLLRDAVRMRSAMLLDLALDLLVPPLAQLVGLVVAGLMVGAALMAAGHGWVAVPYALCALMLGAYILRGWQVSGAGLGGLAALARAPIYLVWKLWLTVRPGASRRGEWVRTAREGEVAR